MKIVLKVSFLVITFFSLVFLCPQKVYSQQYQFGFLSYSKVLQTMPEYSAAQATMQSLKKKYEDYLQGQKNFPEQIMLKRQKELQVAMEQGISFRADAKRLLDNAERELIQPLETKLDSILFLIGKENGLLFIGNSDNHNFPFIHNESGLDITEVVLARLNGNVIPINTANGVKNNSRDSRTEDNAASTPEIKEAEKDKIADILKTN